MPVFSVEIHRHSFQKVHFNAPTMKAAEAWANKAVESGCWQFDFNDTPEFEIMGPYKSHFPPGSAEFAVGHDGEYIE